ncbi:MAG: hypothetical protein FWE85_05415 [Clostridiales bacterium]|nr:hypothetical protein [Clostridiales bacterium]
MKKIFACVITLLLLLSLLAGCNGSKVPDTMPDDFAFKIDFGLGGKNSLDTYENTFTKDLLSAGTATISFVIPAEKMLEIYDAFLEFEIHQLPEDINAAAELGDTIETFIHKNDYSLTYTLKGKTRTVVCNDEGPWDHKKGPPASYKNLVDFIEFITEYIYSTDDYQNMPPAEGAGK